MFLRLRIRVCRARYDVQNGVDAGDFAVLVGRLMPGAAPFRPVEIASWDVTVRQEDSGVLYVDPVDELGPYPARLTDVLDHWALAEPERTFLAKRDGGGAWQRLTYYEFRRLARNAAQWILDAGLSPERPIAILSGNDLEHAILGMAAMYAGIPYAPISTGYSLLSSDFAKLRHVIKLLNPGLVFAADDAAYGKAIAAVVPSSTPCVVTKIGRAHV